MDFKNTVIIMTTNVGAQAIAHGSGFGFVSKKDEESSYEQMKRDLMREVENVFKPEFLGRLDDVVVFRKLTREDLKHIVDIELSKVRERLGERGLKIELTDEAREFIICLALIDGNHFVNLVEIDGGKAYVVDPPRDYAIPLDTLRSRWDGKALLISNRPLLREENLPSEFPLGAVLAGVGGTVLLAGTWLVLRKRRAGSP